MIPIGRGPSAFTEPVCLPAPVGASRKSHSEERSKRHSKPLDELHVHLLPSVVLTKSPSPLSFNRSPYC